MTFICIYTLLVHFLHACQLILHLYKIACFSLSVYMCLVHVNFKINYGSCALLHSTVLFFLFALCVHEYACVGMQDICNLLCPSET